MEVGVLVGSAFLLAMAVWVLEPNTAVVSPTSIPLREVLVLPDAETHITYKVRLLYGNLTSKLRYLCPVFLTHTVRVSLCIYIIKQSCVCRALWDNCV